jgi:hypothetical protein
MSKKSVWAVEVWANDHWGTLRGGLSKRDATREAKVYERDGLLVSIAEYGPGEGESAIARVVIGR